MKALPCAGKRLAATPRAKGHECLVAFGFRAVRAARTRPAAQPAGQTPPREAAMRSGAHLSALGKNNCWPLTW
ncbi:Uncharacterised protein [Bordetella pertussis]|nr:Uncharacterised protein [Bordetella pertussis]